VAGEVESSGGGWSGTILDRPRPDLIARRIRAKDPVPLFVLVIARIPEFLSAPLCVSGPNTKLTWPSLMLRRQTKGEAAGLRARCLLQMAARRIFVGIAQKDHIAVVERRVE
jgi:hypothetical protein